MIEPQIRIFFSDQLPYWLNSLPSFPDGRFNPPPTAVWASFDENTEVPIIYPRYLDLNLSMIQRLAH